MAGAYVHLPFCSAVCPYCDFAVVAGADHLMTRYIDAVIAEIGMSDPLAPLEAIFFGGGTPSRVPADEIGRILEMLERRHGIVHGAEITVEANPEDFPADVAIRFASQGVNRVSLGAQSFDPVVLERLGRRHGPDDIARAVAGAREAFRSVSLDLIFGHPIEDDRSWSRTLAEAIEVGPDHVSCYALTVEPGTILGHQVRNGAPAPDPDVQADRYEAADLTLGAVGYHRYEVSNWSRPGHQCRYNLLVWGQGEYEAYGNGAHRFRDGARSHNVRQIADYMRAVESGHRPEAGHEPIDGWGREVDRLFVGLRKVEGVADGPGVRALLDSGPGRRLADAGVITMAGGRLVVLRPLLTDEVHRAVLGLSAPEGWVEPATADNV